ncbi:hypothetical protein [Pseudoalteromonas xiamenensis]
MPLPIRLKETPSPILAYHTGKKDEVELLTTNAQAVPQNIYPSLKNTIVAVNRAVFMGAISALSSTM